MNINKDSFVIPKDIQGKPSILYMGFSREGGDVVNQWMDQVVPKLPTQNVNHINIVVGKVPFFVERFIINGFRDGPYYAQGVQVGLYFEDPSEILKTHPIKPINDVAIIVLSKEGVIIHETGGEISTQNIKAVLNGAIQ